MSDVRQRLASLSPEQRALLEQRLRARGHETELTPPRAPHDEPAPLSFVQERMWLFEKLRPGSAVYHLPSVVRLRGAIALPPLQQALDEVVRRHHVLRTRIDDSSGIPRQRVLDRARLTISLVDFTQLPYPAARSAAQVQIEREIRRPFALARGPLVRVTLVRLAADEHLLALTLHHLVADEVAIQVLVHEIQEIYRATSTGSISRLPPLPMQYADYARSQRQLHDPSRRAADLAYWQSQLKSLPPSPELPTRPQRGEPPSGAVHAIRLDRALSDRIRSFGRARRASDFIVFLSGYVTLIARYSGQRDLVVGSSLSNRNRRELEQLIGCMLNVVLLRADVSGELTFAQLVERVRALVLDAHAHGDLPFETLMEAWRPLRNPIELMFELTTRAQRTISLGEVVGEPCELDRGAAMTHLTLYVEDNEAGYTCTWEYDTALFEPETIARMAQHYVRLLATAVLQPDQPLTHAPFVDSQELACVREVGAHVPAWRDDCVRDLVLTQAQRTPDAIAVACGDEHLSYAALDGRSATMAARLVGLGIEREGRVGLLLPRSPELMTAMLGIWRAGAAYVPLDPRHPRERVAAILRAADVACVLCDAKTQPLVPAGVATLLIDATRFDDAPTMGIARRPLSPRNLAYLIFTSGTTGVPKAVAVEHGALASLLHSMRERTAIGADDVLLAITTVAFDIAALELWLPLMSGARVHLASAEESEDPAAVARVLSRATVTLMQATPSLWRLLVELGWRGSERLRVLCGGDALAPDLARELAARALSAVNVYGPTETTVWSTLAPLDEHGRDVVLGAPLANTSLDIVGRDGHTVPLGVSGELLIGGDGVARGYFGRADLTAERFIPAAAGATPGTRVYRTGDRVRRDYSGRLRFEGRIDHQIKLHGHRIEPAEIELCLAAHPSLRESVVVATLDDRGDKQLIAYVVPRRRPIDKAELRAHVARRLPEFMVPHLFVALDELPLTPNGKLDRQALPRPRPAAATADGHAFAPPRSPTEQQVAAIWLDVLALPRIGLDDNFFLVGGNSLKAARIVARLNAAFAIDLPLRAIFDAPTVRTLVTKMKSSPARAERMPRYPRQTTSDAPLSPGQHRLWLHQHGRAPTHLFNLQRAVRLRGPLDFAALEQAVTGLRQRHAMLRTRFLVVDGEPVQRQDALRSAPLPLLDLSGLPSTACEAELARVLGGQAMQPMPLDPAPVRCLLARLGDDDHALVLTLHHIVCDALSLDLLPRELAELHQRHRAALPGALPELPLTFGDYMHGQLEWLGHGGGTEDMTYWLETLAPPYAPLPLGRPRPNDQLATSQLRFVIPGQLRARLVDVGRQEEASLFMVMIAALHTLFSQRLGVDELRIATMIANRTLLELDGVVGPIAAPIALRTRGGSDLTFRKLLRRVRDAALGAFSHTRVPFELIMAAVHEAYRIEETELMPLALVWKHQPPDALHLEALGSQLLDHERDTSEPVATPITQRLMFVFDESGSDVVGRALYRTGALESTTVESLIDQLLRILANSAADADRALSQLRLRVK